MGNEFDEYTDWYLKLDISDEFIADLKKRYGKFYREVLADMLLDYLEWEESPKTLQTRKVFIWGYMLAKTVSSFYAVIQSDLFVYLNVIYNNVTNEDISNTKLNKAWAEDGLTIIDRFNKHKNLLIGKVISEVVTSLSKGIAVDQVNSQVKNILSVEANKLNALIKTETNRVINQAFKDKYVSEGYTHYRYTAILDRRTSDICRELDGSIFSFKEYEVGVNAPAMHYFCRSFIVPVKQ